MYPVSRDWIQPDWQAPPNVRAFTTTRAGGVSDGPWSSFNLGNRCNDDRLRVEQNRARLCACLPAPVHWLHQLHGTKVVQASAKLKDDPKAEPNDEPEGDALVSFEPGQACAVLTADCLPVFFCNRQGTRVAVAHAGWRGLAEGVLQATIVALEEDPAELMAWLGPAIGSRAYEVGSDVADAFAAEFPEGFSPRGDRFLMDIYRLARLKLAAAGVSSIQGGGFCTMTDSKRFFSYRRDGITGRMASVIWLE